MTAEAVILFIKQLMMNKDNIKISLDSPHNISHMSELGQILVRPNF